MALFFITGSPGSGKSQLTQELRKRGYEAYDTDDDALAHWQNKYTGYIHPKSSVKPQQRTPEFLAEHEWNVPIQYIEALAKKAHDKPVFVLGIADNYDVLKDMFAETFALQIDDKTLAHRLRTRTDNDWGQLPHEFEHNLAVNHDAEDRYRELGYTIIDATRPLDEVVTNLIAEALLDQK